MKNNIELVFEYLPVTVPDFDGAHRLRMKVGNQSFDIGDWYENKEQAEWMADMLRLAICKLNAAAIEQATPRSSTKLGGEMIKSYDNLKFCNDCKHYAVSACKAPCKECLPLTRETPKWEPKNG